METDNTSFEAKFKNDQTEKEIWRTRTAKHQANR